MAVFSGNYESPGLPSSSNVRGIVPLHCDDRQNGRNGHQNCSPPPPILLVIREMAIYAEPQHKLLFRVVRGGGGDF